MATTTDNRCAPGNHEWVLHRRYIGVESFNVHSVTNHETGDETGPSVLAPGQDWSFDLTVSDERNDDEYDGVQEEWLGCKYCPAEIRGEIIGEIQQ